MSRQLRPDWTYLDLENPDDLSLISQNPTLYFKQFERNLIIDEAQNWPELFNILRGVIDQKRDEKGRFILTGSSSPTLMSKVRMLTAPKKLLKFIYC